MVQHANDSAPCAPVVGVPVASPVDVTEAAPPTTPTKKKLLDLIFTMDCTGSMGQYISAAKRGISAIASRLAQAEGYDLRFGLVAYRDHPPQDSTYVTKPFPFTDSLEVMQRQLGTLSAAGGGDGPEAVAAALKDTCEAHWRDDATKVCILIADAPPHGLGEAGDGFPNGGPDGVDPLVVLDQMSAKGITIYSVGCQPALSSYRFATEFFIAAAERTNGQAVALGSAASLADVILGGAIEEMDLEALTQEVQRMTTEYRAAEPALAEEEMMGRICLDLQSKGTKTRQMGGARLKSVYASHVSAAPSLAMAKKALAEHCPMPAPTSAGLAGFRARLSEGGRATGGLARGGAGAPPALVKSKPKGKKVLSARRGSGSPTSPMRLEELDEENDCLASSSSSFAFDSPPACPPAPIPAAAAAVSMDAPVSLSEEVISMEQVSRLFGRGKKKGLW